MVRIVLHKVQKRVERELAKRRDVSAEASTVEGDLPPEAVAHEPTADEAMSLADEIEFVLTELHGNQPEMFQLCVQGYSTTEIGKRVGCSRHTVRRVLDRIGHQLEIRLQTQP